MRITEKEVILAYIESQRIRFTNEIHDLQQRIRYREIDVVDLTEYMLLIERANSFEEFATNVISILHLNIDN